jgi:hypothetical protein
MKHLNDLLFKIDFRTFSEKDLANLSNFFGLLDTMVIDGCLGTNISKIPAILKR